MLLGPYPQLREWPHVGKPPTRSTIRTMRRSSPITLPLRQSRSWLEGRGRLPQGSKPAARFMYGGQAFSPEGSGAGEKKKTDVAEHRQVFDHVGLLVNRPPGPRRTELPFI